MRVFPSVQLDAQMVAYNIRSRPRGDPPWEDAHDTG